MTNSCHATRLGEPVHVPSRRPNCSNLPASQHTVAVQVYLYKLPSLPGANNRGYTVTDQPLAPPQSAKSPFFGSAGLAATGSAEYIYVGAPVVPQQTAQLAALHGNSTVFVYAVSTVCLVGCVLGVVNLSAVPFIPSG